jgi:hypothetical protein
MNATQLDLIPDALLAEVGTRTLRAWLYDRGQTLSLLDLDAERRRRGIQPQRHRSRTRTDQA